jgi:hypothetical protein
MELTKAELLEILNGSGVTVREGEQYLEDGKTFPKIAYWEYLWSDSEASGDSYETVVTYQVSFASRTPRHSKLLALKNALNSHGLTPDIYHEYVKAQNGPGWWHSYFSVDITEHLESVGG